VRGPGIAELRSVVSRVTSRNPTIYLSIYLSWTGTVDSSLSAPPQCMGSCLKIYLAFPYFWLILPLFLFGAPLSAHFAPRTCGPCAPRRRQRGSIASAAACCAGASSVEVRAENLQGLLPAPSTMAVLEEQSTREPQVRAAGAPPRPNVALIHQEPMSMCP
jgi:hypothetical protein